MKVSGFTFLRNGEKLGYPFVASIRSVLPIVDEFVVALGPSEDETERLVRAIGDPKIRIIPTQWNERIRSDYSVKGYVYGQQKSIALFNCTGDWAFYLEADELVHEDELSKIRAAMERYLDVSRVEALAFDYLHFYGNANTYAWSPRWYRTEARILRNTIPAWGPEGCSSSCWRHTNAGVIPRRHTPARRFIITAGLRTCRNGLPSGTRIVRYWGAPRKFVDSADIDPQVLKPFNGTHPKAIQDWLPPADGLFQADPNHKLTARERKHRLMLRLEKWFGWQFRKKHYEQVA